MARRNPVLYRLLFHPAVYVALLVVLAMAFAGESSTLVIAAGIGLLLVVEVIRAIRRLSR